MSQPPVSARLPIWLNVAKTSLTYRFDSWTRLKSARMASRTQRTRNKIESKDWEGHKRIIRARNRRSGTIQRTEEGITTSGPPSSTANMKQQIKSSERRRLKSVLLWNMNSEKTSMLPSKKGKIKPRSRLSRYCSRNKRLKTAKYKRFKKRLRWSDLKKFASSAITNPRLTTRPVKTDTWSKRWPSMTRNCSWSSSRRT